MLFCCIQGCIKRLISESYGETYPDVRGLGGSYADSSVPHEQCHYAVGLQGDVPWKTDRSQLCGGTFTEVRLNVLF